MQRLATTRLFTFALLSSAWLAGAGPEGCGPVAPTEPLTPDPEPPTCTAPLCDLYCENGFATDANGCETCACNPPTLCMDDSACAAGQACDLSVCLSPCDGREDGAACPAVCYGQCIASTPEPSCGADAPNGCGEGFVCVCWSDDGGLRAPPGPGDQNPEDPYPQPDSCACVPIEPPPPTSCDPTSPSCPDGSECVCAMPDTRDCYGDRCGAPLPAECYCLPPPPPPPTSCGASDPNAPVCGPDQDCVCTGSSGGAACDPDDPSCFSAPPVEECFCVDRAPLACSSSSDCRPGETCWVPAEGCNDRDLFCGRCAP